MKENRNIEDVEYGIKLGAELAVMHGSDATTKELEKNYWKGFKDGIEYTRKIGTWLAIKLHGCYTPAGNPLYICSNCSWEFGTHMIYPDYNFCPNCGTCMIKEKRHVKNV